jgi:glutathione S-transferase
MRYVIHGARGSGSSLVELACAAMGLDFEVHDLDVRAGEHRGEAYRALNPLGKMPTLQTDEGELITESIAILVTLDERHRGAGLLPAPGTPGRARALRWMSYVATELYPIVEALDHPERFGPSDVTDAIKQRAQARWLQRWQIVEDALDGSPHVIPTGFSAADLYVGALSRWDMDASWRAEHLPHVEAIAAGLRSRSDLAPVWARHFPFDVVG